MKRRAIIPVEATYAMGHEAIVPMRTLYVSGQVPENADGKVPADFKDQCRLAWQNVIKVLDAAGMTVDNLAKVTVYLADRKYRDENRDVRHEILKDVRVQPALTVIIAGIYEAEWLLEIEAIAVA